jgi:hypothetical protein
LVADRAFRVMRYCDSTRLKLATEHIAIELPQSAVLELKRGTCHPNEDEV